LGRPYDEKTDKDHLRILSQYGFEFEHLVDANPDGRSPGFVDKAGTIVKAMTERTRLYKAYLEKIKEGPPINVSIKIEGENETTETNPVTLKVTLLNEKKQVVPLPAGTSIEWNLFDQSSRKDVKLKEGPEFTHDAAKQGSFSYTIKLIKKANNKTTVVATQYWYISVKRFDAIHPTKGILLTVPSVIKQYDIFDASLTIPGALKGRELKCNWGYSTIGKRDDCSGAKIQYNSELSFTDKDGKRKLRDSTIVDAYITVLTPGKTTGEEYQISKKVKFQHMSISTKMTDIWEGGSGANWLNIIRKPIYNPPRIAGYFGPKIPKSTAEVSATVEILDKSPWETVSNTEELKAYLEKRHQLDKHKELELKTIAVGDFKGYGVYRAPYYTHGILSDGANLHGSADSYFEGYIMKGTKFFEVKWRVHAGGAFDDSDESWMMNMVRQIGAEAAGILTSASFQPDGRITKSAYTGPKPDGSDYPQVSIEPKIDTIQPGSKVMVKAVIKNDKPGYGPYTYNWSGHVDGNTNGASAQLMADRPGKNTISVNVDGSTPPGSASMEYEVALLKVKLLKVSPQGNKVLAGVPVELKAEIIGPVPSGRKLMYLWQPHPQEKFIPFEGAGNSTKVNFSSPGVKKIWVEIMDKTTGDVYTAGRSDQLELEVISPSFTITLTPAKAVVGQWVTAKVETVTKLEDVNYRWKPLPDNGTLVKESSSGEEIIFYAKNTSPIALQVAVSEKGTAVQLGEAKTSFIAEHYKISVEGPKVQGPKPMIWKPGVGLVEVDKEIAVHQIVEFSAVVNPKPESEITYNWQITSGNASISNPVSRDARITALETGQVQARVTVKDKNGVELGSSSGVFNATISSEMISNGNNQKKLFDEKMQLARKYLQEGKLDEAVKTGLELKEMNPKDAKALLNEIGDACKKAASVAVTERDFTTAVKRCEQALQLNPADNNAKKQLEEIKRWQTEWATVVAKGNELDATIQQHDLPAADKIISELTKLQAGMPGQSANKWTAEQQKKYAALLISCDSAFAATRSRFNQQYDGKEFEKALKELESFNAAWKPLPSIVKQIENVTWLCKAAISNQKKVYDEFLVTRSNIEKGLPVDPAKGPDYLEKGARDNFSTSDPRQKEMIDFARNMKNKQNETITIKARAEKLKAEGQQAEEAGNTETAIRKYRESIALVPNPELEAYIKILETKKTKPPVEPDEVETGDLKLVAWYPFNGNANDESGKGRNGTLRNGVNLTKDRFDKENSAFYFDGTDDYIDISANGLPAKDRTVMFWLKPAPGSQPSYPVTYGGGPGCGYSFLMGYNAGGSKRFNTQGHCGTNALANDPWLMDPSNQWRHFTVTISGKFIKLYINGVLMKSNTGFTNPTVVEGKKLILGGLVGPEGTTPYVDASGGYFKGTLDDIRIYRGAMTDEQVRAAVTEQQTGTENEPVEEDKGVNPADPGIESKVFDNVNIDGVSSGPPNPTQFTFTQATVITRIENYHYFNGGKKPGTIGLRNNSTGKVYGPWQAFGLIGQGGVENAYWVVHPSSFGMDGYTFNIELPAGTYTVIDSDPPTWSYNSQSKGCGFTTIYTRKEVKQPGVNPADTKKEDKIFDNGNIGGVSSGPPNPTQFTFTQATVITRIENYHYFNGGKKPGTIGLRNNSTGKVYGPWQAYGLIGQGGVQNAYWAVLPNIELPAGTYTVIDSDPPTWSYNSQSKGCGFTTIWTAKPGYTIEEVETGGGVTAEKICITGDIDNLGFGFPKGFDVFSGNSTPSHGYPWKTDPNDAKGTDCIMVGTGAKSNSDGYSSNTSRPGNQPQPITLSCMTAGTNIQSAVLQLFVDDFQAAAFGSKFSVTINGRQAAFLETVLNSLNQTGPIGKLISVQLPADFISEIQTGQLAIFIDDATTGRGDGYAVDFVRLIINPISYSYTGTITGIVLRPDGQPAAGASINAGGIISTTTNNQGEFKLNNVPAGMVSINASYNNHHHKTITADLASGKTIRITINLPPDDAVTTTQPPDNNEGVVTNVSGILYGTVFKTKEEAGKTNPFDLEGVPLPNTRVDIQYTYSGTTYTKWVTSDGNGKFQFTGLPLNVTIRATSRGQVVNKTLTTASPKEFVQFGWDGEIIINQP
jgi:tetratricopeptide (TPR) repeat protein